MKTCFDISITHKDIILGAQSRYPLTPLPKALHLLWLYYGKVAKSKELMEIYPAQLRFKLLSLFATTNERFN